MFYETNEKIVSISNRHDITELSAPNATRVNCYGCTGLTALDLPNATEVNCYGCTGLVAWFAPKIVPLLEGGGKSINEIVASGCWKCHDWTNCPLHCAYGANSIDDLPAERRADGAIFISLFDAKMLACPVAIAAATGD